LSDERAKRSVSRLELRPQAAHSLVVDSRVDQTKTGADGGSG